MSTGRLLLVFWAVAEDGRRSAGRPLEKKINNFFFFFTSKKNVGSQFW